MLSCCASAAGCGGGSYECSSSAGENGGKGNASHRHMDLIRYGIEHGMEGLDFLTDDMKAKWAQKRPK